MTSADGGGGDMELEEKGKEKDDSGSNEKGEGESEKGAREEVNKGDDDDDKKEKDSPPPVKFLQLYRFASQLDTALVVIGVVTACIASCGLPILMVLFGDMLNAFVGIYQVGVLQDLQRNDQLNGTVCFDESSSDWAWLGANSTACADVVARKGFLPVTDNWALIVRFVWGTCLIGCLEWILLYLSVMCLNRLKEILLFSDWSKIEVNFPPSNAIG